MGEATALAEIEPTEPKCAVRCARCIDSEEIAAVASADSLAWRERVWEAEREVQRLLDQRDRLWYVAGRTLLDTNAELQARVEHLERLVQDLAMAVFG